MRVFGPSSWLKEVMHPGKAAVVRCPMCSALTKLTKSWRSTNTFGATLWTDGRLVGPGLPRQEWACTCPRSKSPFLARQAQLVGEFDPLDFKGSLTPRRVPDAMTLIAYEEPARTAVEAWLHERFGFTTTGATR